jgi:hypothetical protein
LSEDLCIKLTADRLTGGMTYKFIHFEILLAPGYHKKKLNAPRSGRIWKFIGHLNKGKGKIGRAMTFRFKDK